MTFHELAAPDITKFVNDKLGWQSYRSERNKQDHDKEALIKEVLSKAQGVFFWVTLVVNMLVEGIQDGDSLRELYHKVDTLPSALGGK